MPRKRTEQRPQLQFDTEERRPESAAVMRIQENGTPVRIRSEASIYAEHVHGEYLGPGVHEIDKVSKGPGSKAGWGRLADGKGWVALEFVEILK